MKNQPLRQSMLFLAAIIFTLNLSAQVDIVWGKEIKPDKRMVIGGVVGHDDNGYYIIKYEGCGLFGPCKRTLARHNMNHEVEFSVELKTKVAGKDGSYEKLYDMEDHMVMFFSVNDKKADLNRLYMVNIDKEGNQSEPKLVDEIDLKKRKGSGDFSIFLSEDKTKFLVYHAEGYSKKENEQVNYKMYTNKFELIWEKAVELPYKDKKFALEGYNVDEAGNVYLLGTQEIDKKTVKYKLFAYYFKSDKLEEVDVEFGKAYSVSDMKFTYMDGHLHFMGFYYDNKKSGINGVFYTKINARTLKTEVEKNSAFSKNDLLKFTTARAAKKGKGLPYDFILDDILVKPDGSFYLVAEEYYVQEFTTTDSRGVTRTRYVYNYADIIVVDMTKDADIIWVQKVSKHQRSTNDGGQYSSYILAFDSENLYFIYNDNPKNVSPKTKPAKRGEYITNTQSINKLVVSMTTVNSKGEVSSEMLFKSKNDGKTVLKPKYYQRFSQDKILIYAEKGKVFKFGFLNTKKS